MTTTNDKLPHYELAYSNLNTPAIFDNQRQEFFCCFLWNTPLERIVYILTLLNKEFVVKLTDESERLRLR